MDEPIETLQNTQDVVTRLAVEFGPRLLSAVLILVAGYFVMHWVAKLAARGLEHTPLEPPVRDLLARVLQLLVLALFLLMALQNLGVDLLPLIAGLGIAGAAVALALQGVLGNVAAGLTIIFTRPFRVGEYVSVAGEEGEVLSISLFSTSLRHSDLSLVVIPNRKIAGEILHNYGEIRQLDLRVALAYATDLDAVIGAIRQVLASNRRALTEPPPVIQTTQLGELSISIVVRPWVAVRDYGAAIGEINAAIVHELRGRGLAGHSPPVRVMPLQSG
jgi:small conductance mechanosensitive channel